MAKHPMTRRELLALPTAVDLTTAGHALGFERTWSYKLNKEGRFPVPVLKIGTAYRVPTAPLLRYLGIDPTESDHVHDTRDLTSVEESTIRPANRRTINFAEPVTVRLRSGKLKKVFPNNTYPLKSGGTITGAQLIKKYGQVAS